MKNNNKKYIEYKSSKKGIFFLIILLILTALVGWMYINRIKELFNQNIYKHIEEFSEQTVSQLSEAITKQKNVLDLIENYIKKGYIDSADEILGVENEQLEKYNFTRLVVLDRAGNGKTSDGYEVHAYPNIEEFFENSKDNVYLTENRPSVVSNNMQVNIYAKSFTLNGEEFVLLATVKTSDYQKLLGRKLFGKGGTYLINKDGMVLIDSFNNISDNSLSLYDYFKTKYSKTSSKNLQKIDEMENAILNKEEGTFDVNFVTSDTNESYKENYFVRYEKLGINDWYVITTASDNTIAYEFEKLENESLTLCLGIMSLVIITSIYIITSTQKKNHKIYNIAYIDPVTGLGNESYFKGNGTIFLEKNETENAYIITLDINKFKALNSIYGYDFCNKILKELGRKVKEILPANNITCRISNDIFGSLFVYNSDIKKLLEKISEEASAININGISIQLNLVIGAYKIENSDKDINKILDKSYLARSQVKGVYSDNNYYLFGATLENEMIESQKLESTMKEALAKNEFKVYYQPKVFANSGKVAGAEALVRWYKDGEMIPPSNFIPLFEKNKFIIKLDLYIFEKVCQDLAEWRAKYNYIPTISINVSKEHFVNEDFIDKYVEICNKYEIATSSIDLEITESATIDENIDTVTILNKIKEKGFMISIDDFGTGYSSLSMLQNMPIDIIKIDKIFVRKADLQKDNNIINYIVLIAEQLGAKTIVEGVETREEVDFVNRIHGDIIQGYYFSKPITKEEFEKYFNK